MPTLRIEHAVSDFDSWKQAFDSDPADRRGSGVRRYRVLRSIDNPNMVMIDLEFDSVAQAQGLLDTLREVWSGPGKGVMRDPQALIAESVETREL